MLAQYLPLHFVSTMRKLAQKVGRFTMVLSEPMDASVIGRRISRTSMFICQKSLRIPIKHRHPLGFHDAGTLIIPYSTVAICGG